MDATHGFDVLPNALHVIHRVAPIHPAVSCNRAHLERRVRAGHVSPRWRDTNTRPGALDSRAHERPRAVPAKEVVT